MKVSQLLVAGAALSVSSVSAELATFSPITGITYNVGIPSTTRSAGSGDIFISVSFPARYQWVGIGIGTHMAGASLFVSYTDGQGNVTVSPRDGLGEFMPLLNPEKEVTILAGSKADKDTVVANFRYKATAAELEMQSEQAPWIGSWKTGSPFDTTNRAQVLTQHDDFRMYSLDLASADVGTSQNPFLDEGPVQPVNTGTQLGSGESMYAKFEKAHGSLMGTAWLVVLPIGSIMMRLRWGGVWTHVGIQVLGTLTIIAGFGVGRTLAERKQLLFNNTHTVFGATIFALILVQPFLGMIHHALYMRDGQRTPIGTAHCWYGRAVMILAAVNGGLGLQLAGNTKGGEIAWGVVAGVMLLAYLAASAYRVRDDRTREKEVAREA